jgi:hypothetical protein
MGKPFKMKGFSGFGNSPLTKKTKPVVRTQGPTDAVGSEDVETKKERQARYNERTYTPSVAEVLRKRKGEKPLPKPKDPIERFLDELGEIRKFK